MVRVSYITILLIIINIGIGVGQKVLSFEVKGMSCWSCANTATNALQEIKGVDSAYVNFDTQQGMVYSDGTVTMAQIKSIIATKNFEALFEGEAITRPLTEKEKRNLDIEVIKGGGALNFNEHLSEEKITIFDFYADWCGPCRLYSPKLEHLVLENPNSVSLKKVDVVNWKSDLAKQLTKQYKIPALPFTLIFDNNGKLLGRIEGNDIESVKTIISDIK